MRPLDENIVHQVNMVYAEGGATQCGIWFCYERRPFPFSNKEPKGIPTMEPCSCMVCLANLKVEGELFVVLKGSNGSH